MKKNVKKKSIVVQWKGFSPKDSGSQSRQMIGAAHPGCCRQGGTPCSPKKW